MQFFHSLKLKTLSIRLWEQARHFVGFHSQKLTLTPLITVSGMLSTRMIPRYAALWVELHRGLTHWELTVTANFLGFVFAPSGLPTGLGFPLGDGFFAFFAMFIILIRSIVCLLSALSSVYPSPPLSTRIRRSLAMP